MVSAFNVLLGCQRVVSFCGACHEFVPDEDISANFVQPGAERHSKND